ncbi:MAG TPA: TraR/DksA C4-type zinc finger protein [Desulfosporosinus sp.]|nr:TraR/DksA C4-type zinc finger protein [Desulfosporosinus sp.]
MKEATNYSQLINTLREERADAIKTASELLNEDMRESLGELSVVDNHPADIGTEVYMRSQDVAEHDRLKHRVGAIDAALERFDKGEYGKCEHCGHDIPFERLEALHYTTVCEACSSKEEVEEQHSLYRDPVENEILNNPFSRTFNDGKDQAEFDGEDSWQAVARYGTSDSAQDLGTNRDIKDASDMYEDAEEVIGAVQYIETLETESEPAQQGNGVHYCKDHGLS